MDRKTLDKIIIFAMHAYEGIQDKIGEPIFCHAYRVMESITDDTGMGLDLYQYSIDTLKAIAICHDLIEDTNTPISELMEQFPEPERAESTLVLSVLTRQKQSYKDYIKACKMDPITRFIKIHDLKDNLLNWRMQALPDDKRKSLTKRYTEALKVLGGEV